MKNQINIVNKKAKFEYEFIDTYTCGIVLTGVEVKFIRDGRLSFVDTFCTFFDGELYMRNVSISGTGNDNIKRLEARRDFYSLRYSEEQLRDVKKRPEKFEKYIAFLNSLLIN